MSSSYGKPTPPSSGSPRRATHFSLWSLISGLPSLPSFPIHFLWGNSSGVRSVPVASVRSSHKSEISNGEHSPSPGLSITTCVIFTGQSSWTQPSSALFPFVAFYPHEVKTQTVASLWSQNLHLQSPVRSSLNRKLENLYPSKQSHPGWGGLHPHLPGNSAPSYLDVTLPITKADFNVILQKSSDLWSHSCHTYIPEKGLVQY